MTLAAFSIATLGVLVNWFAAALLAFTIFFYVAIYTMWLKRSTPQNIVIGGAAGTLPPMIGWAAVTGSLSIEAGRAVSHHLLLDAAALGRLRSTVPKITRGPAFQCCRWSKAKPQRDARSDLHPDPRTPPALRRGCGCASIGYGVSRWQPARR